jgi:3-(3-hydroxy-phenyl)propionate hydroxylase
MSDEGPLQPPAPDVATEFVQEQSIANKKRLEESDAKTRKRNLEELTRIAEDPERARQFLLRTSMIASQRRAESLTLN